MVILVDILQIMGDDSSAAWFIFVDIFLMMSGDSSAG